MIRRSQLLLVAGVLASIGLSLPLATQGQSSSASYHLPRQSVDAGAGRASSASYTLNGTIGQADAGAPMTSASYTVRAGFHLAAANPAVPDPLFSNSFEAP